MNRNSKSAAMHSTSPDRRRAMSLTVVMLGMLAIALLTGCRTSANPHPNDFHTNSWLSYKYNFSCNNCSDLTDNDAANRYYCTIGETGGTLPGGVDPANCNQGNPPTLTFDHWKQANGFPASGYPDAHAFYGNLGDLRIGRDMNCVQSNQNVACYVTNYGPPPFDPGLPGTSADWAGYKGGDYTYNFPKLTDAISDAAAGNHPFATVAMVYNPNAVNPNPNGPAPNMVTFYVFDDQGNLLPAAALDGEGNKTNPRMCMTCHGGRYDTGTDSALLSSFLPFDVYYFQYIDGLQLDDQQEGFRNLNRLVKIANTPPAGQQANGNQAAIVDFINNSTTGLYRGAVDTPNTPAQDGYLPIGWYNNPGLYNSVVRQYCRMCHLAQTATFSTYQEFFNQASDIEDKVCQLHDMPNAQVPLVRYWKDGLAQDDMRTFLFNIARVPDLHDCK